jgi:hypothetical protein
MIQASQARRTAEKYRKNQLAEMLPVIDNALTFIEKNIQEACNTGCTSIVLKLTSNNRNVVYPDYMVFIEECQIRDKESFTVAGAYLIMQLEKAGYSCTYQRDRTLTISWSEPICLLHESF